MAIDLTTRPQIFVYLVQGIQEQDILSLLNGLEEEGIPYFVKQRAEITAVEAAYQAALDSSLQVGIGCDNQDLVLHYKNLNSAKPYLVLSNFKKRAKEVVKDFGGNGARLVKGIPFKETV